MRTQVLLKGKKQFKNKITKNFYRNALNMTGGIPRLTYSRHRLPCFELFRERGAVCKLMRVNSACAYQWVHITSSYIPRIALTMLATTVRRHLQQLCVNLLWVSLH